MQNFDEKALIGQVRLLRKQYAGSRGKSKFARALGISASTYSYYENDRVPPVEILRKICEVTGADLEWLSTGCKIEKNSHLGQIKNFCKNWMSPSVPARKGKLGLHGLQIK